jgi:hypothetical protein
MFYVHALMATNTPRNLEVALKEVEGLRRTKPTDANLMLIHARILHLSGPDKAAETLEFLNANRPANGTKAIHRTWNIMAAWASLRTGKENAANLFKGIGNNESNPLDPVHWEYLVGYALALMREDVDANRVAIEKLLAKLPADAFAQRAPDWLKAHVTEIREALAAPSGTKGGEKKPARAPAERKPAKVVKPG